MVSAPEARRSVRRMTLTELEPCLSIHICPPPAPQQSVRSPDSAANPYLAFALLIYAALDGIGHGWTPDAPADFNLFTARPDQLQSYRMLPRSRAEAAALAAQSAFIAAHLPRAIVDAYCSEN